MESEATPESLEKNLESERHEYTNLLAKKEQLEGGLSRLLIARADFN